MGTKAQLTVKEKFDLSCSSSISGLVAAEAWNLD